MHNSAKSDIMADNTPKSSIKLFIETLRRFVPLDQLGPRSLDHILANMQVLALAYQDVLFEIGDTAPFTYGPGDRGDSRTS